MNNKPTNINTTDLEQNFSLVELRNRVVALEDKLTKNYAASCHQLRERGESKSGEYTLQPSNKLPPFNATCKFGDGSKIE